VKPDQVKLPKARQRADKRLKNLLAEAELGEVGLARLAG